MQSTVETKPKTEQSPSEHDPVCIDSLCEAIQNATSDRRAWKMAANWFVRAFDAKYVLIEVDGRSGTSTITSQLRTDDTWQPLCDALLLKSRQNVDTVANQSENGQCAIAAPMSVGESGSAVGAIALAIDADGPQQLESKNRELLAYIRVCESAVRNRTTKTEAASPKATMQQGVSQAGSYESLHHYAFAITNGLQVKFGCDEVAIGMLHRSRAKILSVSGMDSLHPRSPGSYLIQQAMEEAADADTPVVCPDNKSETTLVNLPLHQQWLNESDSTGVASVPLRHGNTLVGVVSLRRTDGRAFSDEEIKAAESLVAPLAPGLTLLEQANRSLVSHAKDTCSGLRTKWNQLRGKTRLGITAALVIACGWMLVGKTTHTVQMPCEVVAAEPIQISSPFESRIVRAHVRPGDFVRAGQPLVEFDTQTLMAEYQRLKAEVRMSEIGLVDALALRDVAAAGRSRNEADAARARLRTVSQQMNDAIVTAPFDGYVLEGDVQHHVGEMLAVGTEILQFAAADKLSIELRVAETDSTYVNDGMVGEFNTTARPGEAWECEVMRVDASGSVVAGQNVFLARADPRSDTPDWLRPGMQGVAKIHAGSRAVWWVYLHGLTDWVSMQAWKL